MIGSISTSVYHPTQGSLQARQAQVAPASAAPAAAGSQQLSPEAQQQVAKLRSIDQKVRAHEQAHISAAGGIGVSGAAFQYQRGPDGMNYAVGGEVQIDTSPGKDPKDTVEKARRIQAAAMAPADPSSQDRAVAAAAAQMEAQASAELSRQRNQENTSQATESQQPASASSQGNTARGQRASAAYQEAATAADTVVSQLLAVA